MRQPPKHTTTAGASRLARRRRRVPPAAHALRFCLRGLSATAVGLALSGAAAQAQILQQYLPDVLTGIGGGAAPIAPDVKADTRGAAETAPGTTVTTRPHPEYDTPGVHVGDFYIRPDLTESIGYNNNLFGDNSGRGAFGIETRPSVSVSSNWARNSISATIAADNVIYPSQSNQGFTNWFANLGGSYDIGRDQLQVQYTHASLHLTHVGIDSGNFNAPIPFQVDSVHLGYLIPLARLSFEPNLTLQNYRFQNGSFTNALGITVPVNETQNNRNVLEGGVTTRYELSPLRDLVLVVLGATQHFYDTPPGMPTQDSTSFEVLTGIDFNVNAVFRVRALVGYKQRNFTASVFQTRTAPVLDGEVIWTPTQVTTVTGSATRSIEDAISTTTNGFTYTDAKLRVDHEYRRNILLGAYAEVQAADYSANQGTQQIYGGGFSATWRLNRNMSLIGSYTYAYQNASQGLVRSYSQSIALLSLGLHL